MAERGIFQKINEVLDEEMAGRRYLISAIDKLRKDVPDMKPVLDELSVNVKGLQAFRDAGTKISESLQKVGQGFSAINQMSMSLDDMRRSVGDLNNSILQMRPVLDLLRSQQATLQNSMDQLITWITPTMQGIVQLLQHMASKMGVS